MPSTTSTGTSACTASTIARCPAISLEPDENKFFPVPEQIDLVEDDQIGCHELGPDERQGLRFFQTVEERLRIHERQDSVQPDRRIGQRDLRDAMRIGEPAGFEDDRIGRIRPLQ